MDHVRDDPPNLQLLPLTNLNRGVIGIISAEQNLAALLM
jgi:hypothetical protein